MNFRNETLLDLLLRPTGCLLLSASARTPTLVASVQPATSYTHESSWTVAVGS